MNTKEYTELSAVTENMLADGLDISYDQAFLLAQACMEYLDACKTLNLLKKSLIYKNPSIDIRKMAADYDYRNPNGADHSVHLEQKDARVLHMVLGAATDAGELLDATAIQILEGIPIDEANILEEIGDIEWFLTRLMAIMGFTPEQMRTVNIAKLKARFGDKFSEFFANYRNLNIERKVLENGLCQTQEETNQKAQANSEEKNFDDHHAAEEN